MNNVKISVEIFKFRFRKYYSINCEWMHVSSYQVQNSREYSEAEYLDADLFWLKSVQVKIIHFRFRYFHIQQLKAQRNWNPLRYTMCLNECRFLPLCFFPISIKKSQIKLFLMYPFITVESISYSHSCFSHNTAS